MNYRHLDVLSKSLNICLHIQVLGAVKITKQAQIISYIILRIRIPLRRFYKMKLTAASICSPCARLEVPPPGSSVPAATRCGFEFRPPALHVFYFWHLWIDRWVQFGSHVLPGFGGGVCGPVPAQNTISRAVQESCWCPVPMVGAGVWCCGVSSHTLVQIEHTSGASTCKTVAGSILSEKQ